MARHFGIPRKAVVDRHTLEEECLKVLRSLPQYADLEAIEIRLSPRDRRGFNWRIAQAYPDTLQAGNDHWTLHRSAVEAGMARFELEDFPDELEGWCTPKLGAISMRDISGP